MTHLINVEHVIAPYLFEDYASRYANYGYSKTGLRIPDLSYVDETGVMDRDGCNDPLRYLL